MSEAARFNVLACGRRWGKTMLGQNRLIEPALAGYPVGWFSPTYRMLSEVWRDVRRQVRPWTLAVQAQERRIELSTGGVIDMWSLDNPDTIRGRKYKRAVIDEAGFVPDLADAWQMVIRPTLTDFKGDGWFLGTPKGHNEFWRMWNRGQDGQERDWKSWRMPTTANPYIDPDEVEAARDMLPERIFQQEYEAAFLEDGGGVFRRVGESATAGRHDRAREGHAYAAGVDWGKHNDWTVISVMDVTTRELVYLDRFNQIDYTIQRGRLQALHERFRFVSILAEANAMGEPIIEQAVRDGMPVAPFVTTNATKAVIIDALALAFERQDIRILNDPVLIGELQAFEMHRLPSGLIRYQAPEGMHDDCVMSLALAWALVSSPPAAGVAYDPEPLADSRPRMGMGLLRGR